MAKKRLQTREKVARRRGKVFQLLAAGKTRKQIAFLLRTPQGDIQYDIAKIRADLKGKLPMFVPPKRISRWSLAKAKRVANLIEFSKKVIEGKEKLKIKKRKAGSVTPAEKLRKIERMLKRDPFTADRKIVKKVKVSNRTVVRQRKKLVEAGKIPDLSLSDRFKHYERKPKRKTHILGKRQRQEFLEKNKKQIRKKASYFYHSNRKAFDFANTLPETIVDELVERLDWKLQTFDPKRMSGQKETKLQRFFNYHLQHIALDLKKAAWRRYRRVISLEAKKITKKGSEVEAIKSSLKAPATFEGIKVATLEKLSRQLKLNIVQKAVLFGLAAGLTEKKIGKKIRYTKSRISQIKTKLQKKVEKLLSE